jgi:hypothetical protein
MSARFKGNQEFRMDMRGKGGKVSRVRLLQRAAGEKFRSCGDEFTAEHAAHFLLFAKAAAAVAKVVTPPFDADAIVSQLNGSRRKKRNVKKPRETQLSEDADSQW